MDLVGADSQDRSQ